MKFNKKYIIFSIALMLLIVSIIYRILNPFVQPRVDKLTFTGKKKAQPNNEYAIKKDFRNESQTLVSKFLNKPEVSGKVYKDLFAIYRPFQKVDKTKAVKIVTNKNDQAQKTDSQIRAEAILEAKKYITSYRFYGIYTTKDTKAVFLAKDKLVVVARIGDRLDGKYLIDDIQDSYITITALDLNETIHFYMREFNNE
ncbi:MAG: hypothetical protein ABIJ59_13395 [Pseudomonadota bacterium]